MAQGAQASALQRTGVAATLASRAMAGLNAATAFVGGPASAALMAGAGAVAYFAMQSTQAEEATRLHETAMRDFGTAVDGSTDKLRDMTEEVPL
ncbi:hypothetical protein ABAZ39_16585 (plasmid) [Azospirillum argentinense]|uniref:Uncharacterized protein n=1 Tax=Azospirillum argentinense TaxID=2970906 RepID=A0A060DRG2_9PROT|nr:hypothetical protein [Azospirillum argentinense]AIB13559.1 hypothetical protein ABAZ39_16585 [Azospirillum argentinense]EZQ06542.1 hypothetical protein ABAZ39_21540 [Azospirillum argentinense]